MPRRIALPVVFLALSAACTWTTQTIEVHEQPAAESSRILAADGSVVATLHAEENRESVPLERIPVHLRNAVIAIEDERFWDHKGVDPKALLRAAYANAEEGRVREGGSTITQQYVKNELVGRERSVRRKIKEASLAYQLEQQYSKERILELYLNTIYFGNGAYGVQAASHEYFGVPVEKVTLGQSALLAGLIRSPARTDPYDEPDQATARRAAVLRKMVELGHATEEEATVGQGEPLVVTTTPAEERYPAPDFVERGKRFGLDDPRFGETPAERRNLLFEGGLKISTTLDLGAQQQAEAAVAKVLSKPEKDPHAALVSLDARTGYVRALVGGRDFFGGGPQDKFDLAIQGKRPAGSSFKPFVLAAALEEGIPLSKVYDAPARLSIPLTRQTWNVDNYEGEGGGRMDLLEATVHSVNTVYARLILDVGPSKAVGTASRMGVTSPLEPFPSAVLGTNDVTPLDMASAYGTLATRGMAVPPVFVTKVVNHEGTVIYEHEHEQRRVLDTETADAVNAVLQQVVSRGTGAAARIGRPVAGKTGTGQSWRDAWFVGYTPETVTAVWVGFPHAQVSMVPPTTRIRVTGGSWPAQIWQLYMAAVTAARPVVPFADVPVSTLTGGVQAPLHRVPLVVGMPVEQAEAMLGREGFRAERKLMPNDEYPPGYVIGQEPAGDSEAPGGTTVTLSVSKGAATTGVPDVLDMKTDVARTRIEGADLVAKVVVQQEPKSPGAGARKGKVWKQTPLGGTRTARGSTVTIYVNPE